MFARCRRAPLPALHRRPAPSVVVGFYRVCVIDQILMHSPADYVRRPPMPTDSPTLGLGHVQFEALLTTARQSANRNDFALIAMLDLPGLPLRHVRHQDRRVAAIGQAPQLIKPRRHVCSDRSTPPFYERSLRIRQHTT
jgi:hypothetical protein